MDDALVVVRCERDIYCYFLDDSMEFGRVFVNKWQGLSRAEFGRRVLAERQGLQISVNLKTFRCNEQRFVESNFSLFAILRGNDLEGLFLKAISVHLCRANQQTGLTLFICEQHFFVFNYHRFKYFDEFSDLLAKGWVHDLTTDHLSFEELKVVNSMICRKTTQLRNYFGGRREAIWVKDPNFTFKIVKSTLRGGIHKLNSERWSWYAMRNGFFSSTRLFFLQRNNFLDNKFSRALVFSLISEPLQDRQNTNMHQQD
jgi:hypothetical protein